MSGNRLRRLPPELGRLTRLQELEMGGQRAGPSSDINGGTQVVLSCSPEPESQEGRDVPSESLPFPHFLPSH